MQTVHAPLFSGITDEQQQRMLVCFGVREESFLPEDLIYDFNDRRNIIGLIISGTARVERVDERGVRTILEHLERESVFGEMLMFDNIAKCHIKISQLKTTECLLRKKRAIQFQLLIHPFC